jgi:hypothetical protein
MNIHIVSMALFLLIGATTGAVAANLWRSWRQLVSPLAVDGLSERADVNGCLLVVMAREMRAAADAEQRQVRKGQLLRWARVCECAALEHLECINAISLDNLETIASGVPVHLGDFRPPTGERRRNPPLERAPFLWERRHVK